MDENLLASVKRRTWFYEFALPDGSTTSADTPPHVAPIHTSRRAHLNAVLDRYLPEASSLTAIDLASHEGYYALELARRFNSVTGIDYNGDLIAAAELMMSVQGVENARFIKADLTSDPLMIEPADFVLCYGLLYHLEDPVRVIRLASRLAKRHLLIETQVFPYDVTGRIEDGHASQQRDVIGVFSVSPDYAHRREGGSTDVALIPSLNALLFLLKAFGFTEVETLAPLPDDYEQFVRGARVIVHARKPLA